MPGKVTENYYLFIIILYICVVFQKLSENFPIPYFTFNLIAMHDTGKAGDS